MGITVQFFAFYQLMMHVWQGAKSVASSCVAQREVTINSAMCCLKITKSKRSIHMTGKAVVI